MEEETGEEMTGNYILNYLEGIGDDGACEYCGQSLGTCDCEDDVVAEGQSRPRCGCRFCFCHDDSEYGEPCSNCELGVHQG